MPKEERTRPIRKVLKMLIKNIGERYHNPVIK